MPKVISSSNFRPLHFKLRAKGVHDYVQKDFNNWTRISNESIIKMKRIAGQEWDQIVISQVGPLDHVDLHILSNLNTKYAYDGIRYLNFEYNHIKTIRKLISDDMQSL